MAAPGAGPAALRPLLTAIAAGDRVTALALLGGQPQLARAHSAEGAARDNAPGFFYDSIAHYLYAGDTALHFAAAAYQLDVAQALVRAGADVSAVNRRGAQPLHYAVDGNPSASNWDPVAQAEMVSYLLAAGADANATDRSGTGPLHRAVRNRCADAVRVLLAGGADPQRPNRSGSTPMRLATVTSGRVGSGSAEAIAQQALIIDLLAARGA